jgi:hypothetical protein
VDQGRLYANWDPAYDYQTSNSSISYNVAVKHKDSTIFIVSPSADINSGTRDISRIGNNFLDTSFYVDITAYNIGDTLEFQVQSIDNGLQASSFTSAIPIVNCVGGSTSYTNMKYCDGDSALWEGNYYSSPGIYSVSHATSLGCDSTLILQLRMDSLPNIMISNTLPDTIKLHDSPYPIPSVTPVGGVLSGNSINGLMIEPSLGNIGLNYIYYTYTDSTTGCSNMDSLMIFILDDTGIEYNNSPAITIDLYPNPSKSEIFIKISQRPKQYLELQISNSSGQLLRSVKEPSELLYKVNVDGLNKGLYFIKVLDAEGYIASKKFILI